MTHARLRTALGDAPVTHAEGPSALSPAQRAQVRVILTSGVQTIDAAAIDMLPNLKAVVTVGAGYDGIDKHALEARDIKLLTGSGINAGDVADLAVGLFLAAARHLLPGDARVRQGLWRHAEIHPVRSVSARAVGIVGMGEIGRAIAARLAPMGCRIAWHGPSPKTEIAHPYVADLLDLARSSDSLIVAAALNPRSTGMISRPVIDTLGAGGLIVNVGRGGLVDEEALILALREGRLGGAGLDVFAKEPTPPDRWRDVPNIVLSPHRAGITHQSMEALWTTAATRAIAFAQ